MYDTDITNYRNQLSEVLERLEHAEGDAQSMKEDLVQKTIDKAALWRQATLYKAKTTATWVDDNDAQHCEGCKATFTLFIRRHHCRSCGGCFCDSCAHDYILLAGQAKPARVCGSCKAEYAP